MTGFLFADSTGNARSGAHWRHALGALFFFATASASQSAVASASLQISPVLVEIPAGGAVSAVNIQNQDSKPASVQVRVFRWSQTNGEESLEPTEDVVASPPIATIEPRSTLNVRVIRAAKTQVASEESYRLVVDQLPQSDSSGRSIVSILVRQVLPVFVDAPEKGAPDVAWSIRRGDHGWVLRARNSGDRHLRIARMVISGAGAPIKLGGGLLGYALAHSEMSWTLPAKKVSFPAGKSVTLRGDSDVGALNATALVSAGE